MAKNMYVAMEKAINNHLGSIWEELLLMDNEKELYDFAPFTNKKDIKEAVEEYDKDCDITIYKLVPVGKYKDGKVVWKGDK